MARFSRLRTRIWFTCRVFWSIFFGYVFLSHQSYTKAFSDEMPMLSRQVLEELRERASIPFENAVQMYRNAHKKWPNHRIPIVDRNGLETLGEMLQKTVQHVRDDEKKNKNTTAHQLQSVQEQNNDTKKIMEQVIEEENEIAKIQEKQKPVQPWEIHILAKYLKIDEKHCIHLHDMATALAILIDEKTPAQKIVEEVQANSNQKEMTLRQLHERQRQPNKSLEFAFRLADSNRDNFVSREDLEVLLTRMMATGFFDGRTLLKQQPRQTMPRSLSLLRWIQWSVPTYRLQSPAELADRYIALLPISSCLSSVDVRDSNLYHVFRKASACDCSKTISPASSTTQISMSDFVAITTALAEKRDSSVWLMEPAIQPDGSTVGSWYRWKLRVRATLREWVLMKRMTVQEQQISSNSSSLTTASMIIPPLGVSKVHD